MVLIHGLLSKTTENNEANFKNQIVGKTYQKGGGQVLMQRILANRKDLSGL